MNHSFVCLSLSSRVTSIAIALRYPLSLIFANEGTDQACCNR